MQIIEENNNRLAKKRAATIMRKSLNGLSTTKDSWLVARVRKICQIQEKNRDMHSFCFENSHEAANWNAKVLESYDNDYQKAVENQTNTTISPGSEFRAVEHIEKIWKRRENWNEINDTLQNGCTYPLKAPLDEKTRLSDLKGMIERGKHKSCEKPHLEISLDENIEKEVKKAFQISLPVNYLAKLKNEYVIPMCMSEQYSINEKGEKIMKPRPCHDASFPAPSGYSVNNDHDLELLSTCQYGQCLRRVIHSIHRMRSEEKQLEILLFKYDFDAAYRRIHVLPLHAVMTIIVVKCIAYLLTRLPFGAASGPSKYSETSEAIFDMANDLINDETWDPDELHSPHAKKLQKPEGNNDKTPFGKAKELEVRIPFREIVCDGYIDDSITVALKKKQNIKRAQNAIPLVVHIIFRPVSSKEYVDRADPLSLRKLEGDGTPSERKLVLGWLLDTREFKIYLPMDKAIGWIAEIKEILAPDMKVKTKQIESTIGRLNHVGYILPQGRYFLNRIRYLQKRCEKYGPQKISKLERKDFELWIEFLENASQVGVNLNLISFTKPDCKIYTDASSHGMGGYNKESQQTKTSQLIRNSLFLDNSFVCRFSTFYMA